MDLDWNSLINAGINTYKEKEIEKIRTTAPANPSAIEQPQNGVTNAGASIPVPTETAKNQQAQKYVIYGAVGLGLLVVGAVAVMALKKD